MTNRTQRSGRGAFLTAAFLLAMVMGAGPGVLLVNGKGPFLGIPAVYAWVVFWFLVQAVIVVIAYKSIWRER